MPRKYGGQNMPYVLGTVSGGDVLASNQAFHQ